MQEKKKLQGQVAIVTGASSGLGVRFAQVLAQAGARVALVARRKERLESLVAAIAAEGGVAAAFACDVTDATQIAPLVDDIEKHFGQPAQILVNNAGTAITRKTVDITLAEIDHMINLNFRAPYVLAKAVGSRLIAEHLPGRIVNISSIGAFVHMGHIPASLYNSTKAGVARMSEMLAVEWAAQNINVNTIAPGFFRSEMSAPFLERQEEKLTAAMPRHRVGEPHQLDTTLLYLVDPKSECVTGTTIKVDDGQMPR